jgi:HPt (histidine-containing phosphotransfer) domain-containing protein
MYIKETPKELEKIGEALKEKKIVVAKRAAHRIKLNIRMLGVPGTDSFFDRMQQKNPPSNITAEDLKAFRIFYDQTMDTIAALKTHFFSTKKSKK